MPRHNIFSSLGLSLYALALLASTPALALDGEVAVDYKDSSIENALNVSDYDRASKLIGRRIKDATKGSLQEAYLHVALYETLIWQGDLKGANSQGKRLQKLLDTLSDARADDLRIRFWDAQSWLMEQDGQDAAARFAQTSAIDLLRKRHDLDPDSWRLFESLSHLASIEAQAGDYDKAASLLQEALQIGDANKAISTFSIADAEEALGGVLYKMGKKAEANDHFIRALTIKNQSDALSKSFSPHEYWLSPVYRYITGAPWASIGTVGGIEQQIIDAGPVRVSAYLLRDRDASKSTVRVGINVFNKSVGNIQFLGQRPELFVLTPKLVIATPIQAGELAGKVETNTAKKADSIRSDGQHATRTMTTYYPNFNNGWNNGRGRQGFWRSLLSDNGNVGTTQVPDFQAEAAAMQKAQQVEEAGKALAQEIRNEGVGPSDIAPGGAINGFLFFDLKVPKNASQVVLKVPIGDSQFEYRFARLP